MEKYLGNKRTILDALYRFVTVRCPRTTSLCDVFAGTTNVGRYFRRRDFDVHSNDINRFSYVLGGAYLALSDYPQFKHVRATLSPGNVDKIEAYFRAAARKDADQLFPMYRTSEIWEKLLPLAQVLASLNEILSSKRQPSFVVDCFTREGRYSAFRSMRGTVGRRNYFSVENARRLDAMLHRIRNWFAAGYLSTTELHLLMTAVIEEVTLVANVNGTFHDFNRARLWPNALQRLWLKVPLTFATERKATVYCQDSQLLGTLVPPHDVLYIDPPYNFRQYTAYYHLLNFIAAYPFLPAIEEYLSAIDHVRGQNMMDDFTSPFCFRDRFALALKDMIGRYRSDYVVLSYYGGRNHWNHWARTKRLTDDGLSVLISTFKDKGLFAEFECVPVLQLRQNYQSRVGERKQMVHEHILWGRRTSASAAVGTGTLLAKVNERLGLSHFTCLSTTSRQSGLPNQAPAGLERTRQIGRVG
jgi:adenine-specific DNA-methyltransferase